MKSFRAGLFCSGRAILASALAAGSLALGSCGGGGGGSPTPTPGGGGGGSSITLTSPTSASVVENTSGTVYTATATATNGQPVVFAIFAGPDADKFSMSASGDLRFNAPPDFEKPIDSGNDNVYQVSISATAGSATRNYSLTITVTNDKEGVSVKRIATGFVNPVGMTAFAGNRELLVAQKDGAVFVVDGTNGAQTRNTQIDGARQAGTVLAIAYRGGPDVFRGTYLLIQSSTTLFVQSFEGQRTHSRAFGGTASTATTGSLFIGGEDSVYAAIGDPGGNNAQDPNSPYGKLVRLHPEDPYSGASSPPTPYIRLEIIGDGIHAPGGGGMIGTLTALADRATTGEEEITGFDHRARPLDFGYPFYEGGVAVRSNPPASVNEPMIAYPHGSGPTSGQGVVFGASYTKSDIASLRDHFIWADVNGKVWSIPLALLLNGFRHLPEDFLDRTADFTPDQGKIDAPVAIAKDKSGTIYILDQDGELFRLDAG